MATLPNYTCSNSSKKNAWIFGVKNLKTEIFTS